MDYTNLSIIGVLLLLVLLLSLWITKGEHLLPSSFSDDENLDVKKETPIFEEENTPV
jgi:hypothetical protein